jgi:hypothetical protein
VKLAASISLALAVALAALPVSAYVRTTTQHDDPNIPTVPVQWNVRCLGVTLDQRGSRDLLNSTVEDTLQRAIASWNDRLSQCGGLILSMQPSTRVLEVANDGYNAVVFRNDVWQRPGLPPYDPTAIALTTVMYVDTPGRTGDGTLLDADVEVNDVNFTFTASAGTGMPRQGTELVNLQNTLTHELGHVMGLGHTCWDHVRNTPPLDNTGQPIPDCRDPNLPQGILDTIMFPFYQPDAPMRPLTDDDVNGVCQVYAPLTHLACWHDTIGAGCAAAPARDGSGRGRAWALATALGALLMAAAARRRQRRPC